MLMEPLGPELAVPVLKIRLPLTPAPPAFDETIVIEPLDDIDP